MDARESGTAIYSLLVAVGVRLPYNRCNDYQEEFILNIETYDVFTWEIRITVILTVLNRNLSGLEICIRS